MNRSVALPHRLVASLGAVGLVVGSMLAVNHPFIQTAVATLPVVGQLQPATLSGARLWVTSGTALVVTLAALAPLFEPRPRRILDVAIDAEKRVVITIAVLAAIGYFDYTYRLPRTTLIALSLMLFFTVPIWFIGMQSRLISGIERAVVIGDTSEQIERITQSTDLPVVGYVAPLGHSRQANQDDADPYRVADGGFVSREGIGNLEYLGPLEQLDSILVRWRIDTAVLAFSRPNRREFFGTLGVCYEHGVAAKTHRNHADSVLTMSTDSANPSDIVDIELEPLNWHDHLLKRMFDLVFAGIGLIALSPIMIAAAAAIKLDDGGPILYSQDRTATFGETFTVHKFRTMTPEEEDSTPIGDHNNDRITSVGRVLRRTHLDEIPQLWLILIGEMSVVGPRAAWIAEEEIIETEENGWGKRWFVKPGLTGLAQINGVSSTNPGEKLRYDVLYIREQSFWFDLKIVLRQVWLVLFGDTTDI